MVDLTEHVVYLFENAKYKKSFFSVKIVND